MTIEALEQRVETVEREMKALAEILTMERRVMESRFAAVLAELDQVKRRLDEMPSAVARTLVDILDERERRGS